MAQGLHLGRDHGAGLAPDHWLHGALVRSFWRHKVDLVRLGLATTVGPQVPAVQ